MKRHCISDILQKATRGVTLSYEEIVHLLSLENSEPIHQVMRTAQKVREQHFGNKLFLYGFIYLSTYCRNHCTFCFYRKSNKQSPRYRKSLDEVVEIARGLVNSGVHLVDLTMGEDPFFYDDGNFYVLFEMIKRVKEATGIPVMISPGVVPDKILEGFSHLKTDWYALYQETHNPVLFKKLRTGQSFEARSAKRTAARRAGMLVEDGTLLGVGETILDRADSVMAMKQSGVHQARVMSFVPQPQTPLARKHSPPRMMECLFIAVMRLVMPDRLIPASLDVDGIKGLEMRLEAGANVVTSIIPLRSGLAGVSQSSLDIEQGLRSVPEVKKIISHMGLSAADAEEYASWMGVQKEKVTEGEECQDESWHSGGTASGHGGRIPGTPGRIRNSTH